MSQVVKRRPRVVRANPLQYLLDSEPLNEAIKRLLPATYNYEVHKCIHQIRSMTTRPKRVALQLPDGLQMFATQLVTLISQFTFYDFANAESTDDLIECVILADTTYGACCIDDFTAASLDCQVLIHYGHSCLVPITVTKLVDKVIYVFVDVQFDMRHIRDTVLLQWPERQTRIVFVGTIQFAMGLGTVMAMLEREFGYMQLSSPQCRPLSRGEVLGCTSPTLSLIPEEKPDAILYVGDGRFHLESMMIANPQLNDLFYSYDPYECKLTRESYDYVEMCRMRSAAILQARKSAKSSSWGLLVGTLGRQGNMNVVDQICSKIEAAGHHCLVIMISEVSREKLLQFGDSIAVFVQTSCPRLSIDWGYMYPRPLLTPYEAMLACMPEDEFDARQPHWMTDASGVVNPADMTSECCKQDDERVDNACCKSVTREKCTKTNAAWEQYPMDFYARDSLGPWTPNYQPTSGKK